MLTGRDRVTVKFTGPPSVASASATLSDNGSSSSVMVPVAVALSSITLADGFDSISVKVSSDSSTVSGVVSTDTVLDSSFALNVSVPDDAVKSAPTPSAELVAVPGAVA